MKRIIMVCSGNICRSPLAAVMAKKMADDRGDTVAVISAGTLMINGQSAATNSEIIATERGLDLSGHRSQGLAAAFVDLADALVVMSPKHATFILNISPAAESKIVRLWEYADVKLDEIADPVGRDLETFRRCGDLIASCLNRWFASWNQS